MTYYLDPFGCVKNQVDAENMMAFLNGSGWTAARNAEDADLIIVNTCAFIESAKQESINAVLSWRTLHPGKKILLAGCLARRYAKELKEELGEADGFFGAENLAEIVNAASVVMSMPAPRADSPQTEDPRADNMFAAGRHTDNPHAAGPWAAGGRPLLSPPGSAYVKISEGCDNRCSFCAIPLIRGALKSRPIGEITEECKTLLSRGIRELCLVAQDSGSYGKDLITPDAGWAGAAHPKTAHHAAPPDTANHAALPEAALLNSAHQAALDGFSQLPLLLEALSQLKGNFRVRLLYIHPDHFPLPILDLMETDKRFIPYFDIPFQHGSEKILKAMNRRGNAGIYLDLIKTIRQRLPDSVIRSTFLTGFPGETEEDFMQLLAFQKEACLDWLGCFTYSREEGTAAYNMKGRVAKKTAVKRKAVIEELQIPITERQMDRFVGRNFDVLVEEEISPGEGAGNEEEAIYLGRLPCQAPEVDGASVIFSRTPLELGAMLPCRIIARAGFDLEVKV